MAKDRMVPLNLRIPADLEVALRARAEEDGRDRSAIVREAIEAYLEVPTLTVEQRLQALERRLADVERGRPNGSASG